MTNYRVGLCFLAALLTAGMTHAQDPSPPAQAGATPRTACVIDDHLAYWLSLEAADRMIASLESERRDLSAKLAKQGERLELMEEGKTVAEGLTLTPLGVLKTSETAGPEALRDAYDQLETRLDEVEKTLKRRRQQRARLEAWLDSYLGAGAADGS